MFKNKILAVTLFATGYFFIGAGEVKAQGIESKLEQQFNLMVNHTPPSVHMGNRRGVISGGSLSIRTPVETIRPFSLQAPSINFGCGGIDIFAGGFSFISKDQLVQVMRSIVSAAVTYAFKLALTTMCPKCENMMSDIQDKLQRFNEFLTNTCEATRNFMDDPKYGGISGKIKNWAEQYQLGKGTATDQADVTRQGKPTSTVLDTKQKHPDAFKDLPAYGNHVWQILQKGGDTTFGTGSRLFYEEIMSMTGTVIACMPDDKNCVQQAKNVPGSEPMGQQGPIVKFSLPPLMTLQQLVEGSAGKKVKRYSCIKPNEGCMDVTVVEATIVGMENKIRNAFNGSGTNPGIISSIRMRATSEPTEEEKNWISVGGSTIGTAMKIAMSNESLAKGFITDNAQAISAAIILEYVEEQLTGTRIAYAQTNQSGLEDSIRMIQQASEDARNQARTYEADANAKSQKYQAALALINLNK